MRILKYFCWGNIVLTLLFIFCWKICMISPGLWNLYGLLGVQVTYRQKPACIHPTLELWHPDIKMFYSDPPPLRCAKEKNWVYVLNGTFHISDKALKKHGNITCKYVPKYRGSSDFKVVDGAIVYPMEDGRLITTDFFEVSCSAKDGANYSNLHSGIAFNEELHKYSHIDKSQIPESFLGLNILMFGFDSTSQMAWIRNLPKSHDFFVNVLKGVVLEGYNIVGDGTPQALLPILTGKSEPELPEARRGIKNSKTVDGHPWIWKSLRQYNYMTQWGEDGAQMGTFTYRMLGFNNQPVDHYMRPFYLEVNKQRKKHEPHCLGSLPRHLNMLNWIKEFFDMYPNKPKFSFLFHSEFSHGSSFKLRLVDDDLKNFLQLMYTGGYFNNTLLILMADHGARFKALRQTMQGKYEERMPYFSLRFPEWFYEKYPTASNNLKANAHILTTPFDIHETFKDIINYSNSSIVSVKRRGISLLKRIPMERTCYNAGIEPHWCACLDWKPIKPDSQIVLTAAGELVKNINNITAFQRESCALLQLHHVIAAVRYTPNEGVVKFKRSNDRDGRSADLSSNMNVKDIFYQVSVITDPGEGHFEATLRYSLLNDIFTLSDRDISRISKYGEDPQCVAEKYPHLRPYCYCIKHT